MARINVYLPDEIADSAKQAELPLSQILREAVLAHLGRLGRPLTEEEPSLRESALRLMATVGETNISETASGLKAGERWASDFAALGELTDLPEVAAGTVTFKANHSAPRFLLQAFPELPATHRDQWLRAEQEGAVVRFKATSFVSGFLDGARMHFAKVTPVIDSLRQAVTSTESSNESGSSVNPPEWGDNPPEWIVQLAAAQGSARGRKSRSKRAGSGRGRAE